MLSSVRLGILTAAMAFASVASADTYPNRPVRIVVAFAAGSSVDLPARLLAQAFGDKLGQPFVVENRGGGGGNIAADAVARAPADGHTLLMATNALSNSAAMGASYDPIKDFQPIIAVGTGPQMLVAHPSLGVDNLQQLITLAKSKPGQIMFGGGTGFQMTRLGGVLLNKMAGIELMHIPYPGSAPGIVDVLAGRIHLLFAPALPLMTHIEKGSLKALATTSAARTSIAPNVPTMAEAGVPGYELSLWYGLVAPAGTPPDIVEKLSQIADQALKTKGIGDQLRAQGIEPVGGSSQEFARFIREDVAKMADMAQAGGLKN